MNSVLYELKKPLIVSFEYNGNALDFKKILEYIEKHRIQTVSVTNFLPIRYLKRIKATFVSVDIDYYEMSQRVANRIALYGKYGVWQIRLTLDGPFIIGDVKKQLLLIKKSFDGSVVLFYRVNLSKTDPKVLQDLIGLGENLGVAFSFLPIIDVSTDSPIFKKTIEIFTKKKEALLNGGILLDSPIIMKELTGDAPLCPGAISIHVNRYGNVTFCKQDNFIVGNIRKTSIDDLYAKKRRLLNLQKKDCYLYPLGGGDGSYSTLSKYYDKIMIGKKPMYDRYVQRVRNVAPNTSSTILDLGCWTGTLMNLLKSYYCNLSGVEQSQTMAEIARKKTKKTVFLSKFDDFPTERKADVVLSTFDSLNYITETVTLEKAFHHIGESLVKNGWFLFDMNIPKKFKDHFYEAQGQEIDGTMVYFNSSYKKPFWKLQIDFIYGNQMVREIHYERFYPVWVIRSLLKKSGFLVQKSGIEVENGRLFVTCRKK